MTGKPIFSIAPDPDFITFPDRDVYGIQASGKEWKPETTREENMHTEQSEQINELVTALVKVQMAMPSAAKKSDNPFHGSKYADLPTCWYTCKQILTECGLAVIQTGETIEGTVTLATTLAHTSGQWIRGRASIQVNPEKTGNMTAQTYGSHQQYLRRYGLCAIISMVAEGEDDDGEGAEGRGKQTYTPPVTTTAAQPPDWRMSDNQPQTPPEPTYVPPAQPVAAAEGTPQAEVGGGEDWRSVVVGFGKNKGKALGDLSVKSLAWYQNDWEMRPKDDGTFWPSDITFRAALDDSKKNS